MNATVSAAMLFDMDDTILDDSGNVQRCWTAACERYAPMLDTVETVTTEQLRRAIQDYANWYWSDTERHRVGRLDLAQARRQIVTMAVQQLGLSAPVVAQELADFYTSERTTFIQPFPGALDVLQSLKDLGIRMALITNGNEVMQRHKIERFGLDRYFDCILIEGAFGVGKPNERVYRHVLLQLNASPSEASMVGDNLEWDVAAPQRLGIFGIWNDYARTGLPSATAILPDRIIHTITELVPKASV